MSDESNFAVAKSQFGRATFNVIRIVKVTDRTHSILERRWNGEWGKRAWLKRERPNYPAMGLTEAEADAKAAAGVAAWRAATAAVDEAQRALDAARAARAEAAEAAIKNT